MLKYYYSYNIIDRMDAIYSPNLKTRDEYMKDHPNLILPYLPKLGNLVVGDIIKVCMFDDGINTILWAIIDGRLYDTYDSHTVYSARIDSIISKKLPYGSRIYFRPNNIIDMV